MGERLNGGSEIPRQKLIISPKTAELLERSKDLPPIMDPKTAAEIFDKAWKAYLDETRRVRGGSLMNPDPNDVDRSGHFHRKMTI